MSEKSKMTKEDASRIQAHADKTGTNQDFKKRAQAAAEENEDTVECYGCGNEVFSSKIMKCKCCTPERSYCPRCYVHHINGEPNVFDMDDSYDVPPDDPEEYSSYYDEGEDYDEDLDE